MAMMPRGPGPGPGQSGIRGWYRNRRRPLEKSMQAGSRPSFGRGSTTVGSLREVRRHLTWTLRQQTTQRRFGSVLEGYRLRCGSKRSGLEQPWDTVRSELLVPLIRFTASSWNKRNDVDVDVLDQGKARHTRSGLRESNGGGMMMI